MTDFYKFTIDHKGTSVYCEISLCSFMYREYGLQVGLSLKQNAAPVVSEYICESKYAGMEAGEEALALAKGMAESYLSENGDSKVQKLQQMIDDWKIESARFEKEIAAENKKMEAKIKKMDAKRKAEGYTHKVYAVIHPKVGGDDYERISYINREPTEADLKQIMKMSAVKNSYRITKL